MQVLVRWGEGLPSSSGGLNFGQQEDGRHSWLRQVFVGQGSHLWPQCFFHDSGGEGGLPAERGPVEGLWAASGENSENPWGDCRRRSQFLSSWVCAVGRTQRRALEVPLNPGGILVSPFLVSPSSTLTRRGRRDTAQLFFPVPTHRRPSPPNLLFPKFQSLWFEE